LVDTEKTVGEGINACLFLEGTSKHSGQTCPVRLYSVEIWNATTQELVGGELGYSVGSIYTSLTGYSNEDSAGSVQLAALGVLLQKCGFVVWDLGMQMDYKERFGAHKMKRDEFVRVVKRARVEFTNAVITNPVEGDCRQILQNHINEAK